MRKSRLYRMTRLVNTCQLLSTSSWTSVALLGATAPGNRPQQNGVAERANRTISDHVTAMLNEAKLPASFWALAVTAYVHVWNRLPTAPLPGTTPYTQWFKRKPDISHFRVFGCTAYVYIQRDKRKSLQPHMEKCIFVGYPSGYKGWQFYNPVTKKFIISERAIFDERSFAGPLQDITS